MGNPYSNTQASPSFKNPVMPQDPPPGTTITGGQTGAEAQGFNANTRGGANNWDYSNGQPYYTDEAGNPTRPMAEDYPSRNSGTGSYIGQTGYPKNTRVVLGGFPYVTDANGTITGTGQSKFDPTRNPRTGELLPPSSPVDMQPPGQPGTGTPPGGSGSPDGRPPGTGEPVPPAGSDPGGIQFGGMADYGSVQDYADQAYDNSRRYLDPLQEQQDRRIEQDLINKGLDPNSEQGRLMAEQLGRQQSDQNSQAMFDSLGFGQGIQNQYFQQGYAQQGQDYSQFMGLENLGYRNQMYGDSRSDYRDALTMALMGMTPVPGMTPQNPAGFAGTQTGYQPGWFSGM